MPAPREGTARADSHWMRVSPNPRSHIPVLSPLSVSREHKESESGYNPELDQQYSYTTRIRTQDFDKQTALLKLLDCPLNSRLLYMPFQVQKKEVLPRLMLQRTRLDLAQVDSVLGQGFQHAVQNPNLVLDRENDRGLVISARSRLLIADDKKTSDIIGMVFDICLHDL